MFVGYSFPAGRVSKCQAGRDDVVAQTLALTKTVTRHGRTDEGGPDQIVPSSIVIV